MCGRFTLRTPSSKLVRQFMLGSAVGLAPRYNIAPSQLVLTVRLRNDAAKRSGDQLRWGLVPARPGSADGLINARSESADSKPTFADAFRHRRCLVLADGFYEWKRIADGRDPYYIQLESEEAFAFAGLWEPSVPGQPDTCAVLTTSANALLETLHERMPVILKPETYQAWLDPQTTAPELKNLMLAYAAHEMKMAPVSRRVNSPAYDDAACIEPRSAERFLFDR